LYRTKINLLKISSGEGPPLYNRQSLTLKILSSGRVLATGDVDWTTGTYLVVSELYDPVTRSWSDTRVLNNGRVYHRIILLNDSVLTIMVVSMHKTMDFLLVKNIIFSF